MNFLKRLLVVIVIVTVFVTLMSKVFFANSAVTLQDFYSQLKDKDNNESLQDVLEVQQSKLSKLEEQINILLKVKEANRVEENVENPSTTTSTARIGVTEEGAVVTGKPAIVNTQRTIKKTNTQGIDTDDVEEETVITDKPETVTLQRAVETTIVTDTHADETVEEDVETSKKTTPINTQNSSSSAITVTKELMEPEQPTSTTEETLATRQKKENNQVPTPKTAATEKAAVSSTTATEKAAVSSTTETETETTATETATTTTSTTTTTASTATTTLAPRPATTKTATTTASTTTTTLAPRLVTTKTTTTTTASTTTTTLEPVPATTPTTTTTASTTTTTLAPVPATTPPTTTTASTTTTTLAPVPATETLTTATTVAKSGTYHPPLLPREKLSNGTALTRKTKPEHKELAASEESSQNATTEKVSPKATATKTTTATTTTLSSTAKSVKLNEKQASKADEQTPVFSIINSNAVNSTERTTIDIPRSIRILKITQNKENMVKRFDFEQAVDNNPAMINSTNICYQQDWETLLEPCKQRHKWVERNKNKTLRTSPKNSDFELVVRPVGFSNEICIEARDQMGNKKKNGGDYWRVTISGPVQMNVVMQDQMNGTYVGYFTVPQPGNYTISCVLYYSMCDGLVDPPLDWFTKGSIQGKFQPEGTIGSIDVFLNEKNNDLRFQVIESMVIRHGITAPSYHNNQRDCKPMNTACGYWRDTRYFGFNDSTIKVLNIRQPKQKLSTLWVYGDSMQRRFYKSLKDHELCKSVFSQCKETYIWIYTHVSPNSWDDIHKFTGDDFNETKFLEEIKSDLTREEMLTPSSVFLLNFGLHTTMTLQLQRAMDLFNELLQMLQTLKVIHGENFPLVIWKTTTPPTIESAKVKNVTHSRFLTYQRIQLWNSFTISQACAAGVPVLDVFDACTAHPFQPIDHVHHESRTFEKPRNELMTYLMEKYKL